MQASSVLVWSGIDSTAIVTGVRVVYTSRQHHIGSAAHSYQTARVSSDMSQVVGCIKTYSAPAKSTAVVIRRDRPVRSTKYLADVTLLHLQKKEMILEEYGKMKTELI